MRIAPFDILKRHHDGSFIWLEEASDLRDANTRVQELSVQSPGDYFVFDQKTQVVLAAADLESRGDHA